MSLITCSFSVKPANALLESRGLGPGGTVQEAFDAEVWRRCEPYTPHKTGTMKTSPGAYIGQGFLLYNTHYAKKQYYSGRIPMKHVRGGKRGRYWFARMKADHKNGLLTFAKKLTGGR